jgi:pimeloyl-ACP methyl ester carboxylesterase
MKPALRNVLIGLGVLVLLVAIGPLIVPVPPLEGTAPPRQLADPDSQFVEVEVAGVPDVSIHYKEWGEGQPALLLIHGFRVDLNTWAEVAEPLSAYGRVVAYDRVGFGLTERPLREEWPQATSPYADTAQVEAVIAVMDALNIEQAVLVGHSAGGTVATEAALAYPQRVAGLVLVDAVIYEGGGTPSFLLPLFQTGWFERPGLIIARQFGRSDILLRLSFHDETRITTEDRTAFEQLTRVENWDRALWEITQFSGEPDIAGRLDDLTMPVLVMTGAEDSVVPPADSRRLAADIPGAQFASFEDCGHIPQLECPQPFLNTLSTFITEEYPYAPR